MSELVSLSAELRRLHNTLARPLENAIQVAAGLEALDGENKRLTEKHRELEQAYGLLQAAHDKQVAALEKEHAERKAALEAEDAKRQVRFEAEIAECQARIERARDTLRTKEYAIVQQQGEHTKQRLAMQAERAALQAELATLRQTLAAEKDELEKYRKHMRAVLDRVTT